MVSREKGGPGYRFRYEVENVDLFAVYVYDRDVLLYIPGAVICGERRETTVRLDPPRNGQRALIRHASEFQDFEEALERIGRELP